MTWCTLSIRCVRSARSESDELSNDRCVYFAKALVNDLRRALFEPMADLRQTLIAFQRDCAVTVPVQYPTVKSSRRFAEVRRAISTGNSAEILADSSSNEE